MAEVATRLAPATLVTLMLALLVTACTSEPEAASDPTASAAQPTVAASSAPLAITTPSSATTIPDCVTVPTTLPGEQFCDGYDPTPPSSAGVCPEWAVEGVARPPDGWLGHSHANGNGPVDGLWRSGFSSPAVHPPAIDLQDQAVAAAPTGFVHSSTSVHAHSDCVDQTAMISVWFTDPDGAELGVTRTPLMGQVNWSEEFYSPTEHLSEDRDGDGLVDAEWAWHDGGTVVKVWMVTPDGVLTKAVAYAENTNRMWGFPTTMPTIPDTTRPPVGPLTLDAEDLMAFIRSVAGS